MSNIKKIRQEIERRKEELERDKYINIDAKTCRQSELKYLERFIDSLPEETHKESLQVQETCKENPDSFTDEPKEMSVDDAMKYIDEKIAKTMASKSWEGVDVDKFLDEIRGRETDDLEEAAIHYLLNEHSSPLNAVFHQADLKSEMVYHKDIENAFIAGAKWQSEHGAEKPSLMESFAKNFLEIGTRHNFGFGPNLEQYKNYEDGKK